MVWYDFAILALLVYTMWSGAQRGFVTQLAWIAALVLCFKFADTLAPAIEPQINVEQPLRHWIAMLILYLGFSLGCFMVARILNSWMEKAKFKDFDRHLGGLLGLVKGGIIAMVITFFAVTLSDSLKATVMKSYTGPAACWVLDTIEPITPDHFKEYLEQYHESLGGDAHDSHLGTPTSFNELFGMDDNSSVPPPKEGNSGIRDIFDGLINAGGSDNSPPAVESTPSSSTFDNLLYSMRNQLPEAAQNQLKERWQQSSPTEKQSLINTLSQSLQSQFPNVLNDFLTGTAGQGSGDSTTSTVTPSQIMDSLNVIGDLYGDREYIVNEALARLDGAPLEIQKAVIDDWYADWTHQGIDPDPSTARNTQLDDRILSQVNKKQGVWTQLSLDIRRRLTNSRK